MYPHKSSNIRLLTLLQLQPCYMTWSSSQMVTQRSIDSHFIYLFWCYEHTQWYIPTTTIVFLNTAARLHSAMKYACRFCRDGLDHPKYVYLARDKRIPDSKLSDAYCYLGLTRHPFHRLEFNQNRKKGWKIGSKATRPIAPHWKLELILGPFNNGQGEAFKQAWRRGARRFRRRVKFGVEHASAHGLTIYCREKQLIRKIIGSANTTTTTTNQNVISENSSSSNNNRDKNE